MPEILIFILASLFWLALIALYAAPGLVALKRGHPQVVPIVLINIFLGATAIGWVVALAWASSSFDKPSTTAVPPGDSHV